MTLLDLAEAPPEPVTLTERVAAYFKASPGVWIDARALLQVGGFAGWRTRISDCRTELGMTIENRTRRVRLEDGRTVTQSEYRWVP